MYVDNIKSLTLRDAFLTLVNSRMSSNRNMYMSTALDISAYQHTRQQHLQHKITGCF